MEPSEPARAETTSGASSSLAIARSSARVKGFGRDLGIDSGASSTRASGISTPPAPGLTIAPPNRNPAFSANTRASPLGTPASRKRPSASVVVAVRLDASPDWKTEAAATPLPSRSTTRPETNRSVRNRRRTRSGSLMRSP